MRRSTVGNRLVPLVSAVSLALAISAGGRSEAAERRLSDWLNENPPQSGDYPLGLSWRVPSEVPVQQALLLRIQTDLLHKRLEIDSREASDRLLALLEALPPTGRVNVSVSDARWLQANPARDPVLRPGHSVHLPKRPETVTVVTDQGFVCVVPHKEGLETIEYLYACGQRSGDWVWIAQPDGRVARFGVSSWNEEAQDEPAPGAWIWGPSQNAEWQSSFSDQFISYLATQGPVGEMFVASTAAKAQISQEPSGGRSAPFSLSAPGSKRPVAVLNEISPLSSSKKLQYRSRNSVQTQNDWGMTGLLQTPTARTAPAGHFSFTLNRVSPYARANIVVSPFDALEVGLKYTNIENRLYGPAELSGSQAYKDKAFDLKFRLWRESRLIPQVAVGLQDLSGTGLFSGEYVVANKRTGSLDWSLGVGWGYLGARGDFRSPFFSGARAAAVGQGGNFSLSNYFHGPAAIFGGVQYQTGWNRLMLKLEYDGNDYQHEPLANNLKQRSRLNAGLVYRYSNSVDLTAGLERGNSLFIGLALRTQLDGLSMPKVSDPIPLPVVSQRPSATPDWTKTSAEVTARTGWRVERIDQIGNELRLTVNDVGGVFWRDRLDRIAAVLHRDAPSDIDRFIVSYKLHGTTDTQHVIDRDAWTTPYTEPLPPRLRRDAVAENTVDTSRIRAGATKTLYENSSRGLESALGVGYQQILGGPDAFFLYQLSAVESATYWIRDDTWLSGALQLPVVGNFDRYKFKGDSLLPRVRTFQREYYTSPGMHMPLLQVTHKGRLTENQFVSAYGGYLESMFAGIGGEWLYRPRFSSFAYGIDINQVQQRDFDQRFGLRNYRVTTGHGTLYWDPGWNNVIATLSTGRYLAGDVGSTLEVTKVFNNGIAVGAFASKTNISAEQFGEGSFDKGLFLRIPFDTLLTRSSNSIANFVYRPLTRDGAQKLNRSFSLYDDTGTRNSRAIQFKPAQPPIDELKPADLPDRKNVPSLSAELQTQVVPRSVTGPGAASLERRLEGALTAQGFQDVKTEVDQSRTLRIGFAGTSLRPLSQAFAAIARTATAYSSLDTRSLRITFSVEGNPVVIYEFLDISKLQEFWLGRQTLEALSPSIRVQYENPSYRESNPLAALEFKGATDAEVSAFLTSPAARIGDDVRRAAEVVSKVDWIRVAGISTAAIVLSSALDKRAYQFAKTHKDNDWSKGLTRLGDAVPFVALAGASAGLVLASDPKLSLTSHAATEAGLTAVLTATAFKALVGRERPADGVPVKKFSILSTGGGHDAFPSRHTTVAWATLTPFAIEYDAPWLYAFAGVTQIGRVTSRQHWFSDTVAGSLIGSAIGQVFHQSTKVAGTSGAQWAVSPRGVVAKWEFN